MSQRLGRLTLVVSILTSVLALTAGAAAATSQLSSLAEIHTADDDMGSTGIEWSGATFNADSNVLLTVDDEHNAYEFALAADGSIDQNATPRLIELELGAHDFEGVAWISGEKYAFLSEGDGEIIIATVPAAPANGTTTIDTGDIERTFPVAFGSWGNLGPEGVATDGAAFYVTKEMPATLTKFDFDGTFVASVDLTELADASGVAVVPDGTFFVISHESRMIAHYDIDWTAGTALLLESRDADLFTQLEGIAIAGDEDLHLFGENNARKGQLGQTYSHLNGQIVLPQYSASDINCSGAVDVADALIITRIQAGLSVPVTNGCGDGDHNGDGVVDVKDALLIMQCEAGISNMTCPG